MRGCAPVRKLFEKNSHFPYGKWLNARNVHNARRLAPRPPYPQKNLQTGTKSRILFFLITGCRGHPCRGCGARSPALPPLSLPIVRRFLRDEHVMHMAFAHAGVADFHELRALAQFGEVGGAEVSHAGLEAADELFDI